MLYEDCCIIYQTATLPSIPWKYNRPFLHKQTLKAKSPLHQPSLLGHLNFPRTPSFQGYFTCLSTTKERYVGYFCFTRGHFTAPCSRFDKGELGHTLHALLEHLHERFMQVSLTVDSRSLSCTFKGAEETGHHQSERLDRSRSINRRTFLSLELCRARRLDLILGSTNIYSACGIFFCIFPEVAQNSIGLVTKQASASLN